MDFTTVEIAAAAVTGLAVAGLLWAAASWVWAPAADQSGSLLESWRAETLRAGDPIYRCFESLILRMTERIKATGDARAEAIAAHLPGAAEPLPWTAPLYLARAKATGTAAGVAAFAALTILGGFAAAGGEVEALLGGVIFGGLLGLAIAVLYPELAVRELAARAQTRVGSMKARLTVAIDLLALTMEAGATFTEALEVVVRENRGTPLGDDLAEVLREIQLGRSRAEALTSFDERVGDPDVGELVFAVIQADELGSPLSRILKDQAREIRLKRSQRIEKAAAEAQVKILLPGLVVMVASMLVIVTPFVLKALETFL